jgi:4-hydroxy-4-methyl-2-oxoglutarate aldolase
MFTIFYLRHMRTYIMAKDLLAMARTLTAATIYETQGQVGDMDPIIKPVVSGFKICGPAFTVKCFIGDCMPVVRAIDAAEPGNVIVVDGGESVRCTIMGGTTTRAAKKSGLAGFVINVSTRDVDEIRELGVPVFAAGVSVRGTQFFNPGHLQIPVSVGGVVVRPGDWIVGDSDGVVVVPKENAEDVFERAIKRRDVNERDRDERLERGESLSSVKGMPPEYATANGKKR